MSYELRLTQPGRTFNVASFRERVPGFESASASVHVERKARERGTEEQFTIKAGSKRFEGRQENVGASAQSSTCYAAVSVKNGVMTLMPLADWYAFRPAATHTTIGLDEAETLMAKSDRRSALHEQRLLKLRKDGAGAAADAEDDPAAAAAAAAIKDEDEFDDGAVRQRPASALATRGHHVPARPHAGASALPIALGGASARTHRHADPTHAPCFVACAPQGPDWAASEMAHEDGNEGLDMEGESHCRQAETKCRQRRDQT